MSLDLAADIVITGLLQGGLYSLIAMGLSLQYGVARIFNVSHGEFIMFSAFLTWLLYTQYGINPILCTVCFSFPSFLLGAIFYSLIFSPLKNRAPSPSVFEGNCLLASFGMVYILQNLALALWGGEIKGYTFLSWSIKLSPTITIVANRLLALILAIGISIFLYIFLMYTRMGKAIRASAENPEGASLTGVNVNKMISFCFSLGTTLAVMGGALVSMCYPISAVMGLEYTVISIIVVVLGGLGSISGSFWGGLLLGFIGSLVSYWDVSLSIVAYYFVFMVLLLLRPTGLTRK